MGIHGLWKVSRSQRLGIPVPDLRSLFTLNIAQLVDCATETWSLSKLTVREGFEGSRTERLYVVGVDVRYAHYHFATRLNG